MRVVRQSSEHASWELASKPPPPALAGDVQRYVGYVERSAAPLRRREVPQHVVTVILGLGDAPMAVGAPDRDSAALRSFVAPLHESPAITEFSGVSEGIQIDLSPFAARKLLGGPMRDLDSVAIGLEELLGRDAERMVERLRETNGWDARFELLDRFLARRLADAAEPPPDVVHAWRRLRETSGRLPIGALAGELGCSRRHLVARFRDHVGPAPKTAARIMRFRRVLHLLRRDDGTRLAELAQECGYYDQAHLNRDFRDLAGTTPLEYVGSRLGDGLGVAA